MARGTRTHPAAAGAQARSEHAMSTATAAEAPPPAAARRGGARAPARAGAMMTGLARRLLPPFAA